MGAGGEGGGLGGEGIRTIKVKLVSSATRLFHVYQEELGTMTDKLSIEEIRSGRQEARRVQGIQDQVIPRRIRRCESSQVDRV